ncbi:UDP-2,3-diacylglucosamine diphosphatase LpxI [Myxococcota bacterium]|nr:UDP-2,3-diacylglucosamine diphosphatase LpxI [Myxococcota bacterium]
MSHSEISETVGLIAGAGRLPLDIALAAAHRGVRLTAIAFRDQTAPEIAESVDEVTWLLPGQALEALDALESAGARRVVMAGKVPKGLLFQNVEEVGLDNFAARELASLPDRLDNTLLRRVVDVLASRGIEVLPQTDLVPELLGSSGSLGRTVPSTDVRSDVRFGWPIAKAIAGLDIGQTVVVKDGAVLAVEAIEGTDEAIRRAGSIASGACVIKVAKPGQDLRFDVPTIGPDTVAVLARARAVALAYEADCTVVLDRERTVSLADQHSIALFGVGRPEAGGIAE